VDDEGNIDRRRLAQLVFSDPSALSKLNNLVHPAVRARARLEFEQIRSRDPQAVIIYVAAILIESGAYKEAGKIIVVNCSKERQFERAMARPGATEQDVLARIATQMPLQAKLRFADYVIDTDGTKQDTLRQTEEVYKELRNFAA
jgi:dephospho-CoA kinase